MLTTLTMLAGTGGRAEWDGVRGGSALLGRAFSCGFGGTNEWAARAPELAVKGGLAIGLALCNDRLSRFGHQLDPRRGPTGNKM